MQGGLELRDPLFLFAGLLAPVVYALASRRAATVTFSSVSLVRGAPRSARARLERLPAGLLGLAVLALAVALAGPRTGDASSRVKREGIAIAMVVDRSGSMRARDFVEGDTSKSRLDVVKAVFHDFVAGGRLGAGRPDDLIGLVAFARYADGLCPLTLDHGNLLAILDDVEIAEGREEDGTAIGEGLALAVERLRHQDVASKVVVLLTDGVNNAGDIDPLHAADLAAEFGIRVYAIGAGTTGIAPIPVQTRGGATVLRAAHVEIDERTLQQIAERSHGQYFHAADADGLARVVEEIDHLERSEVIEVRYLQYEYHYAGFVGSGLALLATSALLSGTWLRRLP